MKQIKLTRGLFTTVDDEDYDFLNLWKWYAVKNRNTFYAAKYFKTINGIQKIIYMHRAIMNPTDKMQIDHIDHDGLNNQKSNLRIVTHQQNMMNQQTHKKNSSNFKGVSYSKRYKLWKAEIVYNQKHIYLGCFKNETDGAIAYNQKAVELFGEYAQLNQIPEEYKDRTPVRREKTKAEFSSPHIGVAWYAPSQKWVARINKNKKQYHLGYFLDEEAAHQAYLKAKESSL